MDIHEESKILVAQLINGFKARLSPKNCIAIDRGFGSMFVHPGLSFDGILTRNDEVDPAVHGIDFVVTNTPFGERVPPSGEKTGEKQPASLSLIRYAIQRLSDNGWVLANIEPVWAYGVLGNDLRELLSTNGCSIAAFFVTKAGFYLPLTAIRAPFILIKRGTVERELCIEVESLEQIDNALDVFFGRRATTQTMLSGAWLPTGTFRGPLQYEVSRQFDSIQSDYKAFRLCRLSDVAKSVNAGKTGCIFAEQPNTIYIPSIGDLTVVTDLAKTTKKHQNYFQVVLDPSAADCNYLKAFLSTDLGQLSLSALISDGYIPRINKSTLLHLTVPLPDLVIQTAIANTIQKLDQISEAINGFANNLSINPISATGSSQKIDQMLEVIGELADSDKVVSMARGGESKTVEFKETLSLDVRKGSKEKYIEDSVIKTVAAFLNSNGGTLLVGVNDAGAINGVDIEIDKFHWNADKYLLHLRNLIKNRIGEQFYPFINQDLVAVSEVHVLMIECTRSTTAVFVDEKDFFVRTNPATDKLEGPKLADYLRHHFRA